jgi:osmotically-inducible protein OsmY
MIARKRSIDERGQVMSNEKLVENVSEELNWDPKVHSEAVAVSADDGEVTLRGTVGSLREKREAKKAAERVHGVVTVKNELRVLPLMSDSGRADADLRGDILQALMLDVAVPATVDADVYEGYVTLTGTAEWQYEREEAESVAANIRGVVDVDNEIEITGPPPDADEVKDAIKHAFKRNARLDADALSVESSNGTITVKGTVSSWTEHDEAISAAWAAPGVQKVHDRILVAY